MDEKARELYVKDPVPQLTIAVGQLVKRVQALEEQTKFLILKHFVSDDVKGYSNRNMYEKNDFEFAIKHGSVEDIVSAIKNTGQANSVITNEFMPKVRQHPSADKIIQLLKDVGKGHLVKGGKTYRRKLKGAKHTRKQ
jgi:hypothetical protein